MHPFPILVLIKFNDLLKAQRAICRALLAANTVRDEIAKRYSGWWTTGGKMMYVYEVRPRRDKRGFDLISDALSFGRLWCAEPNAIGNAIGYANFYSRSHDAVIRVYDAAGNVIETHEHKRDFKP